MEIKYCPKCHCVKSHTEFHKQKGRKDGLQSYCKLCMNAANKSWAIAHPEEAIRHKKEFHEKNPEWKRVNRAKARARRAGVVATLTHKEWIAILDSYEWKCAYCGGEFEVLEHVLSVVKGGGTIKDNVVPSCRDCNGKKHAWEIPRDAYVKGYISGYLKALQDHGIEVGFDVPEVVSKAPVFMPRKPSSFAGKTDDD